MQTERKIPAGAKSKNPTVPGAGVSKTSGKTKGKARKAWSTTKKDNTKGTKIKWQGPEGTQTI